VLHIQVFKGVELFDTVQTRSFLIVKRGGELCWEPSGTGNQCKAGVLMIWMTLFPGGSFIIKNVSPPWILVIDGVVYPEDRYYDVLLEDRTVELRYLDYRFVSQWK